ncbi:unnamed protein product [Alopecurus aequalis]
MEEGVAATVSAEEAVHVEQHCEGSTLPTVVPKEGVDADQHTEGVTVPEGAVSAEQHAEGSTVPMVTPEEAVDVDQRAEGSTVPMVVPEEAVDGDQHAEGSTAPMVVMEEAVDADKHAEGSTVPMVVSEEASDVDGHAEGSTVPMVVTEEAVDADKHAEGSTVSMVMALEAVHTHQHVEGVTPAPMVTPEVASDGDYHIEDATTQDKQGDTDGIINVTPEEMRGIIEVIADTGKFWHEWSFLKRLLSLQLMQVLGEYSEVQMVIREDRQQQNSLSAQKNSELFSQLNDALLRFEEGPPFTLQRLCEILLDPKGTYKKLSKLAFALEKTLLVTTTITKCTDPYPVAAHGPNPEATVVTENTDPAVAEPEKRLEHPVAVPNGTEHAGGVDGDEEMADADAEEAVPCSSSHDDVEMQEEKPDQIADVRPGTISGAAVSCEATVVVSASGESPDPQS